jgi:dihydrofolate reductase
MRRVRYSVAMSLDGYIAGPKGEYDWIVADPEIDFRALFDQFDTFFLGRKTFEMTGGKGAGGGKGTKTYVFSTTLDPQKYPKVTVVSDKVKETVAEVKAASGKDVWLFGGGALFRSLLALGCVDAVEVAVIPVLLGGGIPLLPAPADRAKLKLTSHAVLKKTGTLRLEYAVTSARKR